MIRFRTRLLTLVLAAGAALVAVQPVAASSPISVAGTFFFVAAPVPSGFRMADGNAFVTLSFPAGVVTGDITGNFTEQLHIVTHPDGSQNLQGNATCTCAVGGRTGTLVFDNIAGPRKAAMCRLARCCALSAKTQPHSERTALSLGALAGRACPFK